MNLTVIGAGYVGLSLGLCLAGAGHQVLLSETDEKRYLMLRQGICCIFRREKTL